MKKSWLTVLVVLIFLGFLALAFGLAFWSQRPAQIQRQTVLELAFDRAYPEHLPFQPLTAGLFEPVPTLRSVVEALDRAAADERVVGIVAKVGAPPMGLGSAQELRDAVLRFRQSGKPAIAWAETLGEFRPGNVAVYLASAFDTIYLQPSGDVTLTGLLYEAPFYRGLLDKLDIEPSLERRYEYKGAPNSYTETSFTAPQREALQRLADSHFSQIVAGIAEARGLPPEEVRRASERGPLLGREAVDAGLVDELAYRDAVYAELEERFEDPELVSLSRYSRPESPLGWAAVRSGRGRKVALIYGVGAVMLGESDYDPLLGGQSMGSDTVARAFRDAVEDDDVEAILFRVSSPGGSYVASDTIWREVNRAREAGKPVVVSMGNVAASGGYFVSMAADAIVAQPATVTGSIGVYAGKLVTRGMWAKAGISFDDVRTGERAAIWSGNHPYDAGDRDRLDASLDRIYDDFTAKVAEGRSLTRDEVHEVARGRIWTGEDALERGLVDELGGFAVALRRVREEIGADEDQKLDLQTFPGPRSPFELLREGRWIGARAAAARRLIEAARPVAVLARELGLLEERPGVLRLQVPGFDAEGR